MSGKSRKAKKRLLKAAQADIVERLSHTSLAGKQYKGLAKCGAQHCAMKSCTDVCRYGSARRVGRLAERTRKLFKKVGGPYFEVHVGRQVWQRAAGDLNKVSLQAVKQVERNGLDKLHMPGMAAVGMVKAAFVPDGDAGHWHVEIHQIIAGAERDEITSAFSTRLDGTRENHLRIDPVTKLKSALWRVLDQEAILHPSPWDDIEPTLPKKKTRREYYCWALGLRTGERVIRYGCDRHFKRLKKRGRTITMQPPKKRNAPWLEPYQFGSVTREQMDLFKGRT
jgi:hypothetical protein